MSDINIGSLQPLHALVYADCMPVALAKLRAELGHPVRLQYELPVLIALSSGNAYNMTRLGYRIMSTHRHVLRRSVNRLLNAGLVEHSSIGFTLSLAGKQAVYRINELLEGLVKAAICKYADDNGL